MPVFLYETVGAGLVPALARAPIKGCPYSFIIRCACQGMAVIRVIIHFNNKNEAVMNNSQKNILLVDDVPINIQLLGAMLRTEGYAISFAGNGKKAIELAKKYDFDLILMDIMMPGMDGFEVFEVLKQNAEEKQQYEDSDDSGKLSCNSVPVIFLTAKTDNESILKAFSLGAVDYICKPFRASEVLARVRTQLELADSKAVLIETNRKLLEEIALRKKNEQMLKESESIYRRLVESVPAIVYSFSNEKGLLFISSKVKKILGYSVDQFRTNPFLWQESVHPEDKEKYINAISQAFSGNYYDIKYRIKGAEGEWHCLLDRSFGLHVEPDDEMCCVEGIAIDITEQKKMEQELFKLVKLESAGMFAGGIAHDMNNLNSIVSGNIELVREDLGSANPSQHLLNDAFEAVVKQTKLIQQLVTLTESFQPRKTIYNIDLLIRESILHLGKELKSTVQIFVEKNLHPVELDRNMIKSAFENILINADESMLTPDIIKVCVNNRAVFPGQENNEILVAGNYVVISVHDRGVGISQSDLSFIFDPYYSKKARGSQKGMGLGLAMALSMVQKHGGYIFVDSTAAKGSVFSIYLPAMS
ncbi:MAG: response regulator [Desulfamplus sp.]|nr:response regulator [Desulfamplus sp.]